MSNRDQLLVELRRLCDQRDKLEDEAVSLEKARDHLTSEHRRVVALVAKLEPQIRACEKELITGLTGFPLFDAAGPVTDQQEEPKPSRRTARTTH